ncbi:YT521-B-like domain-containing protein [Mariannaea sp. PMI_226]|nr:YT521-B-like domain-containing protein [Mariannaea sp. PMI_226]
MEHLPITSTSTSGSRNSVKTPSVKGDAATAAPNHGVEQHIAPQHGISQTQPYSVASHHTFAGHPDMSQNRQGGYNMAQMANSLPQVSYRPSQYPHVNQQRYAIPNSPSLMQQMPQYAGHQTVPMHGQGYYVQQPHMGHYYGGHYSHTQPAQTGPPRQNVAYYPHQMMVNQQTSAYYYSPLPQYPPSSLPPPAPMMPSPYINGVHTSPDSRVLHQSTESGDNSAVPPKEGQGRSQKHTLPKSKLNPRPDGNERRQNAVRGPPRKPRQSGYAIWIGNLPPQTDLMTLVQHVCKEAAGLESLFLISKSNCAFANFKDQETCALAQQKLHESKFQTIRLVSRLRKSGVEVVGLTPPTGPAKNNQGTKNENTEVSLVVNGSGINTAKDDDTAPNTLENETANKDRFFILKSLTVEDLELSVKTGLWATQSHNEKSLNEAFKSSDNVYLIFSANKSGEYFGYARMISEINEDPKAAIEFAPKTPIANEVDLPKAIPTDATEHAPKGRIIDDSARGTIFWEAERDESDSPSDNESVTSDKSSGAEDGSTKTWGKPFKLQWLSTCHLPFYRTRGLRNPWNSNREVKIARDGTELEPSAGQRLVGLFSRLPNPAPLSATVPVPTAALGFPMRPYG